MRTFAIVVCHRFDSNYQKRYDKLLELLSTYPEIWMEAPSMFILKTDEEIGSVEEKIRSAGFQPETDTLLVIDVTEQEAVFAGRIENLARLQAMFQPKMMN
ncbi:hypothetical protein ABGN05_29430 [Aquibium sp. LZ166]|uniref:Uncharacterized protein n=1 Tax=Aquibium pacificus TaxID=3153579 RepID=A0ABV3SST4_9HYPH